MRKKSNMEILDRYELLVMRSQYITSKDMIKYLKRRNNLCNILIKSL